MGNVVKKIAGGRAEKKEQELRAKLEELYNKNFKDEKEKFSDFYAAICETIQDLNKELNSSQFKVPDKEKLNQVYKKHGSNLKSMKKEEFQKILQEVILETGLTGYGSLRDMLFFIFGIPAAALFIKQGVAPNLMPDEFLIPGVTSVTVFGLAKLNKI